MLMKSKDEVRSEYHVSNSAAGFHLAPVFPSAQVGEVLRYMWSGGLKTN
jgi:hypothetical protein